MFEHHERNDNEEPHGGNDGGEVSEGGEPDDGEQGEGAGKRDRHHVTQIVPAFCGGEDADNHAMAEDYGGAGDVCAQVAAGWEYAGEEVGIAGEDGCGN